VISDGHNYYISGLCCHQSNILFIKQIANILLWVIVLVRVVRRANRERRLKVTKKALGREPIVGAVVGQYHYIGLASQNAASAQARGYVGRLHVA
jgi:hypothetical protein